MSFQKMKRLLWIGAFILPLLVAAKGKKEGIEIPLCKRNHGLVISHTGYTLSFDTLHHTPFWVAWQLTKDEANGTYKRANDFRPDPLLPPQHAVWETAYSGSGYDRGHMCPAGDQKWSERAMSESFFMSNMCPQARKLNQEWWEHLERAERRWAANEGAIYIVCGPIYDKESKVQYIGNDIPVAVPNGFFKVILSLRPDHEKAIGFIYRNDDSRQPMGDAACTVDEVERITGIDFFYQLPQKQEKELESMCNLQKWK